MANANQQITMTNREKWALETKSKAGWRAYYIERDYAWGLAQQRQQNWRPVANALRGGEQVDITHLTQMFLELYDKVGEHLDCPVCFEELVKDNTHLPLCGHLICKGCKANPQVDKCPICRKKY